jgi:hypothetical protein
MFVYYQCYFISLLHVEYFFWLDLRTCKSTYMSLSNKNSILQLPGYISCDPDHGFHSKMFFYKNIGMLSVDLFHWLHFALNGRFLIENTSVLVEMVTIQQSLWVKLTLSLDILQHKFNINSTQIQHKFNRSW